MYMLESRPTFLTNQVVVEMRCARLSLWVAATLTLTLSIWLNTAAGGPVSSTQYTCDVNIPLGTTFVSCRVEVFVCDLFGWLFVGVRAVYVVCQRPDSLFLTSCACCCPSTVLGGVFVCVLVCTHSCKCFCAGSRIVLSLSHLY